jgi:hypothetical protein
MFKCDKCGDQSPVGTPMTRVATETRERAYANNVKRGGEEGGSFVRDSVGTEIVTERKYCVYCAGKYTEAVHAKGDVITRPKILQAPGHAPQIASEYVE